MHTQQGAQHWVSESWCVYNSWCMCDPRHAQLNSWWCCYALLDLGGVSDEGHGSLTAARLSAHTVMDALIRNTHLHGCVQS